MSECGNMRTGITLNTDTFYPVIDLDKYSLSVLQIRFKRRTTAFWMYVIEDALLQYLACRCK